jgi:hypothetical protein
MNYPDTRASLRIIFSICASILAATALAQGAKPDWIADSRTGCRVWSALPLPGLTISWSGACESGLAQGQGVAQWYRDGKPGSRYEGEYRDGKANGHGVLTGSGNRYEGEFRDNYPNGRGLFTYASGNRYEGEVRDGKRHGKGVYSFASGDRHEGEFRDGKANGKGVYRFANGDRHEGEYRDGLPNGRGTFTYASGDRFVGEFRNGKANGVGSFVRGDETFSGTWSNGCFRQGGRTAAFGRTAKECGFE